MKSNIDGCMSNKSLLLDADFYVTRSGELLNPFNIVKTPGQLTVKSESKIYNLGDFATMTEAAADRKFVKEMFDNHYAVLVAPEKGLIWPAGLYEIDSNSSGVTFRAVDQYGFNTLFFLQRAVVTRDGEKFAASGNLLLMYIGAPKDTIATNTYSVIFSGIDLGMISGAKESKIPIYAALRNPYTRSEIPPINRREYIELEFPSGEKTTLDAPKGTVVKILRRI